VNAARPELAALEALIRSTAQEELVARFRRTARQEKAAGSLMLAEAGGFADTPDGRPAPFTLTPRSAVCAADPQLFEDWRAWLRAG